MALRDTAGSLVVFLTVPLFGGCSTDLEELRARAAVETLAESDSIGPERAMKAVLAQGRRAIPHIEMMLHEADVEGRLNLIAALRRLSDVEGVPLLGHRALRDDDERVRSDALATLRHWAGQSGQSGQSGQLKSLAAAARDELLKWERATRSAPR